MKILLKLRNFIFYYVLGWSLWRLVWRIFFFVVWSPKQSKICRLLIFDKRTFLIVKTVWNEVCVKSLKYICLFFRLRDNLTNSSINGFFWSNIAYFGFTPQNQFLIYIFFIVALCDCNQKSKPIFMSLL